jgi:cytochrome c553
MNSMRPDHAGKALFATIALLLAVPVLADAGDAERGRKLVYTCLGCHGIENYKNAYPKYSVPKLGGQSATYIAAALAEYDAGARWHPTMKGMASTLSTQDRADLGAWFQGQKRAKSVAMPVGTLPVIATACTACHGQDGVGTVPENPTLAGQHADYLAQTLNDYRLGKRQNSVMGTFAGQLTRDDIQTLAAYFSSQRGLTTPKR